ncbi:unnamed protein product, partial [Closterium sp. NIES-54]
AALDHLLAREDIDVERIVVFGRSLGGAVGADLVHRNPHKVRYVLTGSLVRAIHVLDMLAGVVPATLSNHCPPPPLFSLPLLATPPCCAPHPSLSLRVAAFVVDMAASAEQSLPAATPLVAALVVENTLTSVLEMAGVVFLLAALVVENTFTSVLDLWGGLHLLMSHHCPPLSAFDLPRVSSPPLRGGHGGAAADAVEQPLPYTTSTLYFPRVSLLPQVAALVVENTFTSVLDMAGVVLPVLSNLLSTKGVRPLNGLVRSQWRTIDVIGKVRGTCAACALQLCVCALMARENTEAL